MYANTLLALIIAADRQREATARRPTRAGARTERAPERR
jgi:hypothetical protein